MPFEKTNKDPENRPIRVYAAILVLAVLIAGVLYLNRNSVPGEIKDAVSSGKDSIWTYNSTPPVSMELKTPEGNTFRVTYTADDRVAYSVNGRPVKTQQELNTFKSEFDLLMLEMRKRTSKP